MCVVKMDQESSSLNCVDSLEIYLFINLFFLQGSYYIAII